MKYSFYWKFILNTKLNVNIVTLIGRQLEINMNRYKKNLFSNILKIQPMAFQLVKMQSRKCIGGKPKTIRTYLKKAVDANKRSRIKLIILTY